MDVHPVMKKCLQLQFAYFTNSSREITGDIKTAAAALEGCGVNQAAMQPLHERLVGIKVGSTRR